MDGSAPRPRAILDQVAGYRAGRPAGDDLLKLSSNENPYPPLPGVVEQAAAELSRINRYPDAGLHRLYDELAVTYDLPPTHFAAGTGSVAVLFALLQSYCDAGDEVVMAWRSFEAYPIAVQLSGATPVRVPLRPDATHDLDAMLAAVTERTKVVLVCTPNNPTGPVVEHGDLVRFVDALPPHVVVIVDEAYVEFVRAENAGSGLVLQAEDRGNVVVLRTFSKAFGLAGLRVGYAIAPEPIAETVRKATPPFAVTDVAQAAAVASLRAGEALGERVEALVAERAVVIDTLRSQGWEVPDSQANFAWLPLGDQSLEFAASTAPLSVRPFDGDGVRVTIGTPEADERFLEAAARWITRAG